MKKLLGLIFLFIVYFISPANAEWEGSCYIEYDGQVVVDNEICSIRQNGFSIDPTSYKHIDEADNFQIVAVRDVPCDDGSKDCGYYFYANKFTITGETLYQIEYNIEKELLLALMGIETNFGTYVGKMDILSSLATLSFDQRRSEFFTNELLTLLKLIDNNHIDYKTLYGSWAGAFGFFQFMPSTMKNYAIDYDNNNYINLKDNNDAYASAANYLGKIGWKNDQPCFYKVDLSKQVPKEYLNVSAKKLKNKKKLKYFRKYINNSNILESKFDNLTSSIITPDKDIIPNAENLSPAYIVFDNYEIILKWNRSLRFSLAVCTLKEKFSNEL